jgi:hypothetical protein
MLSALAPPKLEAVSTADHGKKEKLADGHGILLDEIE